MSELGGRVFSTAIEVKKILESGMWRDAGAEAPRGLYLQVTKSTTKQSGVTKSWLLRYKLGGRTRYAGLGQYPTFGLADARARAVGARKQISDGIDPIEERKRLNAVRAKEAIKHVSLAEAIRGCIAAKRPNWSNVKHAAQWQSTFDRYVNPLIGKLHVQDVDVAAVMRVLQQPLKGERGYPAGELWTARAETAHRVRGRIEAVLDWASAGDLRTGDNPARWSGRLENLLSKKPKAKHHAALPDEELPGFMEKLALTEGKVARALEFLILTAGRSSEVLKAKPEEIDRKTKTWSIPEQRMKSRRPHRVPLSDRALEVLSQMADGNEGGEFIFAGGKVGRPLSDTALLMLLRRMGYGDLTAHGFRSTFRTWSGEETSYARELAEAALAHRIGNDETERAYMRGDLFDRRRELMNAWDRFCGSKLALSNVTLLVVGRG